MTNDTLKILGRLLNRPPVSVEVIPGDGSDWPPDWLGDVETNEDHKPFLFIEGNLGVPHKILYKAYMAAISGFQRIREKGRTGTNILSAADLETMAELSAVLLLANPAHQTALNTRKQLVYSGALEARRELQFCAALLVVKECSKQSVLWHHRRWLFRRVYASSRDSREPWTNGDADSLRHCTIPTDVLREEFVIITRACETYPRNYFAWTHRVRCLESLLTHSHPPILSYYDYQSLLLDEMKSMRTCIERHVSDYTAVHYFCRLYTLLLEEAGMPLPPIAASNLEVETIDHRTLCRLVYAHAKSLQTAYPEHESVWLYLRSAIYLASSHRVEVLEDKELDIPPQPPFTQGLLGLNFTERHLLWLQRNSILSDNSDSVA